MFWRDCSEIGGQYLPWGNIIWVCEKGLDPVWVEYHEVWHWIWFNDLSKHNRDIYERVRLVEGVEESLVEDFANSYANWRYGIKGEFMGKIRRRYFDLLNYRHPDIISSVIA
jgi:hypothetical protein